MKKVGLIDYYLDQYHAANYPHWLSEASNGEVQAVCAWAKIDKPDGKSNVQCAEEMGVELLSSPEEVIERCDCLLVMSPDCPEMHEELCRLPLASGKPTYVDKTFAPSRAAAQRIIEIAAKSNTPFFSTSALRYAKEYRELPREGIDFVSSRGPGMFSNYAIHQVEPIVCLMGTGVEKVMYTGTADTSFLVLRYRDGRCATMAQMGWECSFAMDVSYRGGNFRAAEVKEEFYPPFIADLSQFFRDGVARVAPEVTLEIITILEYAWKAKETPDVWLKLPE